MNQSPTADPPRTTAGASLREATGEGFRRRPFERFDPSPAVEPDDGRKWPRWAVTLFVVGFCGSVWAAVGFTIHALFFAGR